METSEGGGSLARAYTWAGDMLRAGALGVCLTAYVRAGKGTPGFKAALSALRDDFPQAHPNSLAAVIRVFRQGLAVGNKVIRNKPLYIPTDVPDVRRLIRDARRVKRS